jgi:hypothetical protein
MDRRPCRSCGDIRIIGQITIGSPQMWGNLFPTMHPLPSPLRSCLRAFLFPALLLFGGIGCTMAAPPANDHFGAAIALSGLPVVAAGPINDATREAGEPAGARGNARASVWWTWTCPVAGWVEVMTIDNTSYSWLAVYTGSSLPNLASVLTQPGSINRTENKVRFPAVAGTVYQIQVQRGGHPRPFVDEPVSFEIKPTAAAAVPFLEKLTLANLSADVGSREAFVGIEMLFRDTKAIVDIASFRFTGPGGDSFEAAFRQEYLWPEVPGKLVGRLVIPPHRAPGAWHLSARFSDEFDLTSSYGGRGQPALPGNPTPVLTLVNQGLIDAAPPSLLSATLSHSSLNVTGGSRFATLNIAASDDSEVREIRVKIIAPAGGGFFSDSILQPAQRISGTAQSGIWQGALTLPAFSPPGGLTLSYQLSDAAGRTIEYSATATPIPPAAASTVILTNTGIVDVAPPALLSFQASPAVIDTSTGPQTVTIEATLQDPETGLGLVYLELYNGVRGSLATEFLWNGFYSQPCVTSPLSLTTTVTIPQFTPSGYYYWSVNASDKYGYWAGYGYPLEAEVLPGAMVGFLTISNSGPLDEAPMVTAVVPNRTMVDVTAAAQTIGIEVTLVDAVPGLRFASLWLYDAAGKNIIAEAPIVNAQFGPFPRTSVSRRVELTVPRYLPADSYRWVITAEDANRHMSSYGSAGGHPWPGGFSGVLEVRNTGLVEGGPVLTAAYAGAVEVLLTGSPVTVEFRATLQDDLTGLASAYVELRTPDGTSYVAGNTLFSSNNGDPLPRTPVETTTQVELPRNLPSGIYTWRVGAYDSDYRTSDYGAPAGLPWPPGFSGVLRVVNSGTGDALRPTLHSLTLSPEILVDTALPATVTITVQASDNVGVASAGLQLAVEGRNTIWVPLQLTAGTAQQGTWTGSVVIDDKFKQGTHGLIASLSDGSENYASYGRPAYDDTFRLNWASQALPVTSSQHLIVTKAQPDAYQAWQDSYATLLWRSSSQIQPNGDFDGDGLPDAVEFLCGTDPTLATFPGGRDPDASRAPVYSLTPTHFRVDYHLSAANAALGSGNALSLQPQSSPDLSSPWRNTAPTLHFGDNWRAEIPRSPGSRQFIRFAVMP